MLLAGVHDNAGVLIFAWTHDELGISVFALDAYTRHQQTVSTAAQCIWSNSQATLDYLCCVFSCNHFFTVSSGLPLTKC